MKHRRKIPIPAKNLFALLRYLGVRHSHVATALRLSRSQVTEIANGKRMLPTKHAPILYLMLLDLIGFTEVGQHPLAPGVEIRPSAEEAAQFRQEVLGFLTAWVLELNANRDLLRQEIEGELARGAALIGKPLADITPEDIHIAVESSRAVVKAARFISQLAETNTNHKPDPEAPLFVVLRQCFVMAGIDVDHLQAEADPMP